MATATTPAAFAQRLAAHELGELFVYPQHDDTIERIWQAAGGNTLLEQILDEDGISAEAKFLACEVLFKKDILFLQRHAPERVARLYAFALRHDLTGRANSWGLLQAGDDPGPVGIAFLTMGRRAIAALLDLLGDEAAPLAYEGSIEASVGNRLNYRVKDFAAYYLGRILGRPLPYFQAPADRDRQIDALRNELGPAAAQPPG